MMIRKLVATVAAGCMAAATGSVAFDAAAADRANRQMPAALDGLKLARPLSADAPAARVEPLLLNATGRQEVLVRLRTPAAARAVAHGPADRIAHRERLKLEQSAFVNRSGRSAPSARTITSVQTVLNGVFMEVDASQIRALAADPMVERISRVANYTLDLSETVPYITATAVQNAGYTGKGVRVAVLDSGVDYTHAAFGGPGTEAGYEAAWGTSPADPANTSRDGLFPTAKVVDGYDFVGESWPNGDLAPDPDPIDLQGHGTNVADIIAGENGVAPDASLVAVKVCSAVATSCSGIAMIQGIEFAVDPNGDGDTSDRVDIINMSLGSVYGQAFDDDMVLAVDNASALGVLTVASAGNSSDKPYVTGTPAAAISAISVAQTQVPSAALALLSLNGTDYPAEFQPWSTPLAGPLSGPLQYGNGAGGNLNGCAAFAPGSLAGKVVLVDRGACNFTLKIKNIGDGGGVFGIIGLIAPGAPFAGGDGGERPITVPGYMISQAHSNAFKAAVGATVSVDPANQLPLAMQMVGGSSRGPRNPDSLLKPDIGAPGASVSAVAGSGTGTTAFGGTSGAAPMVTGSAALLLQAFPNLSPPEVRARLMNNGLTDIATDPFTGLAPVSRIGGGEVRVQRALEAPAAAWDNATLTGSLSFGAIDVSKDVVNLQKMVRVRNYSNRAITYNVVPTFRYADDAALGAVQITGPGRVTVRPRSDATFPLKLTIRGAALRGNYMNSGSLGADPASLTLNEFDGYLVLDDGRHPLRLPWHLLPRKAAEVKARPVLTFKGGVDTVSLSNIGVGAAQNAAFSLLAVSPNQPEGDRGGESPMPDLRAFGATSFPVPAGFCSANPSFVWQFAVNTWERQSHLLPVRHYVVLDVNGDGIEDFLVFNGDVSGLSTASDGRQLSWVWNLQAGTIGAFFFAEHATNTANTVLTICAEQIGLNAAAYGTRPIGMALEVSDFYFGGPGDIVTGLTVIPGLERYIGVPDDVPGKSDGSMTVYDFGAVPGVTDELGVLLFTNGDRGTGNRGGATADSEALIIRAR